MIVKFKKLIPTAVTPTYSKVGDAGLDLTSISIIETIHYIEYGTGIAVEIPEGHVGLLFPRSSITKKGLMLKNSVGIIDSNYRGEIKFRFLNTVLHHNNPVGYSNLFDEHYCYKLNERIGQLIIIPIPTIELVESEELSDTTRNAGGFGSTGN